MDTSVTNVRELLALLREDAATAGDWTRPGFHAVALHRLRRWAAGKNAPMRVLMKPLMMLGGFYVRSLCGIELAPRTEVGRRVLIAHQGGIVISAYATISDDCLVRQNVTIGGVEDRNFERAPFLEKGVRVGAGAVLIGEIRVGEGAVIGPNAVVVHDIAPGSRVLAPPSREVSARDGETAASSPIDKARTPELGELVELLRRALSNPEIDPDTPLLSTGFVDSLSSVVIVDMLADEYGVRLGPQEVDASLFDTPAELHEFLVRVA
jgi:serine O-acetyltransferase